MRRRPRDPLDRVFFLDECLGRHDVSQALIRAGARIELYHHHFEPARDDRDWAPWVGERGWAVLSVDKFNKRRGMERRAFREARLAAFLLTATNLDGAGWAEAFVKALPRMLHYLEKYSRPLLCTVTKDGNVLLIEGQRRGDVKR